MHSALKEISDRILTLAVGALAQANTHAAFADPGNEHWDFISVANTAHAGELFLKAIIAKEHPLLIFKDLFNLDDRANTLDLVSLIKRGKTHDFDKLPQVLWVTTGQRVPNPDCFDRLRRVRNSIQHFCAPDDEDFRALSLEFIYTIIDPLIRENFGLYAIEYHEDHSVGYDYVVGCVVRHRLKFSLPKEFNVGEIELRDELDGAEPGYRSWLRKELKKIGREDLLNK